jgi:membrane-associated phospholipid phosphatase
MSFSLFAGSADHRSRVSPVSYTAILLTLGLMAIGVAASVATKFDFASLPNILLLVLGVAILDVLIQFAPPNRIVVAVQTFLYGFLYLAVTIVCGVLAAYAMQRLTFPLQDGFLESADKALGFQWFNFAYWVDDHPLVQQIFYLAYHSIMEQTLLPLVVFVVANRIGDLRHYLLAYAIAFVSTIIVSALMPAAGPIALVDRATFHILQFTGATPLDHLALLRGAGPLVFDSAPGGIATFPSFHATIAVLTTLSLRHFKPIFIALLFLNAAMLCATLTEGAHYLTDIIAGSAMAFFGYAAAKRILVFEDRYRFADRNIRYGTRAVA